MANDNRYGKKGGSTYGGAGGGRNGGSFGGRQSGNGGKAPKNERKPERTSFESANEDFVNEDTLNTENAVAGRNAVAELIRSGRDVDKVFVKDGEWEGAIKEIVALAKERGIPVAMAGKPKLDKLCGGVTHQGIVAIAAEKQYCSVEDILKIARDKGEQPFIVIADGINDPHNLGTLIRVADGAGCHGLIIPKRRNATLTAVVSKASAGALAHLPVAKVTNINSTIEMLKKEGLWIYAAEAGGQDLASTDIATPAAFIFGSEGEGVSRLVKENSDVILSIPMRGKVNSLNVSSAAAVVLFHASRAFFE
jgi:23S rRNA (guanosine2251-2'-O)-methyltransferase